MSFTGRREARTDLLDPMAAARRPLEIVPGALSAPSIVDHFRSGPGFPAPRYRVEECPQFFVEECPQFFTRGLENERMRLVSGSMVEPVAETDAEHDDFTEQGPDAFSEGGL